MKQKIYLLVQLLLISVIIDAQSLLGVKENLNQEALSKKVDVGSVNKVASGYNNIICDLFCQTPYIAGTTMDLVFKLIKNQTYDTARIDYFSMQFPIGITPNSSPNLTFPSSPTLGSPANLNLPISSQIVSWGIDSNDNFGGINTTSVGITFTVNVTIDPTLTGTQTVGYYASSDTYGSSSWPSYPATIGAGGLIYNVSNPNIDIKTEIIDVVNLYNCSFDTDSIHVKVTNNGSTTESNIIVHYLINGVSNSIDTIFNSLSPGDFSVITFTPPFAINSINHVYDIKIWSELINDMMLNNDTSTVIVPYPSAYNLNIENYINGIETAYDIGSLNLDWIGSGIPFNVSQTNFHSGAQSLYLTLTSTIVPSGTYEAFANFPCVDLVQGSNYKFSYWKKSLASGTLTTNGETAIFMGLGQDATSMTYTLKPYAPIGTTTLTGTNGWIQDDFVFTAWITGTYYFSIGGKGFVNNSSDRINVRIDDVNIEYYGFSSGIHTLLSNEPISIFPNPTTGIVSIESKEEIKKIKILNNLGEEMLSIIENKKNIDVSNIPNGIYLIEINTNNGFIREKFIKQ